MITRGSLRGLWALHKCDNPPCVNPHHLHIGTDEINHQDACARGQKGRLEFDEDTGRLISNPEYFKESLAELLLDVDLRDSFDVTIHTAQRRA